MEIKILIEKHPFIEKYPLENGLKYLIIGTCPPSLKTRNEKFKINYYYGNKGSLWNIVSEIYNINLKNKSKEDSLKTILNWQKEYSIGIVDTLKEYSRLKPESTADADLRVEWNGYNHNLKKYIFDNIDTIEKILFTSNGNCNSAFSTFKIIMGDSFNKIAPDKLISNLPSPSGSSNTSNFNYNDENTLGIEPNLYNYILNEKNDRIQELQNRWTIKAQKLKLKGNEKKEIEVPSVKGILADYKIWAYKKHLPKKNDAL
jgi:G:T/U-mismatch repair DNA glycosylase